MFEKNRLSAIFNFFPVKQISFSEDVNNRIINHEYPNYTHSLEELGQNARTFSVNFRVCGPSFDLHSNALDIVLESARENPAIYYEPNHLRFYAFRVLSYSKSTDNSDGTIGLTTYSVNFIEDLNTKLSPFFGFNFGLFLSIADAVIRLLSKHKIKSRGSFKLSNEKKADAKNLDNDIVSILSNDKTIEKLSKRHNAVEYATLDKQVEYLDNTYDLYLSSDDIDNNKIEKLLDCSEIEIKKRKGKNTRADTNTEILQGFNDIVILTKLGQEIKETDNKSFVLMQNRLKELATSSLSLAAELKDSELYNEILKLMMSYGSRIIDIQNKGHGGIKKLELERRFPAIFVAFHYLGDVNRAEELAEFNNSSMMSLPSTVLYV